MSVEHDDLKRDAINQWEIEQGKSFDDTVEQMVEEMTRTLNEFHKHFQNEIRKIDSDTAFAKYLSNALRGALFELVKYVTPAGKAQKDAKQRDFAKALFDLKAFDKAIEGFISTSLMDVNKVLGHQKKIKVPKKLPSSIKRAIAYLEPRASVEKRGRPSKGVSVMVREIFDALDVGFERDLARSYGTDADPNDKKPPTSFIHPDIEIVFRISKRVFPDVSCRDVISALKGLKPRNPVKK